MKIYEKIVKFLSDNNVAFEEVDHEAVYTSEQAAKVRGLSLKEGAKSLLLKVGKEFMLAVLPGDRKLDSKKIKELFHVKDLRFATPSEVKEIMDCEIGACYPFGNLIGVRMIVDNGLSRNRVISFNPGVHTKSVKIFWEDYFKSVKPQLDNISI